MGESAAMACTAAVEEVIDAHYLRQIETLGTSEPELYAALEEFRDNEIEHRDTARAHGADEAPAQPAPRRGDQGRLAACDLALDATSATVTPRRRAARMPARMR